MMSYEDGIGSFHIKWLKNRDYLFICKDTYMFIPLNVKGQNMNENVTFL